MRDHTNRPTRQPGRPVTAAFERGLQAARQYLEREGTLEGVSRRHVETVIDETGVTEVKLGVWLANQKVRRASLTPQRAAALNELGIRWT